MHITKIDNSAANKYYHAHHNPTIDYFQHDSINNENNNMQDSIISSVCKENIYNAMHGFGTLSIDD